MNQATNTSVSANAATDGSGSVQYYFEVTEDAGFSTGLQQSGWQAGTSFSQTLTFGTTYYWHVKSRDAGGNESSYTATWSFTTSSFVNPDTAITTPSASITLSASPYSITGTATQGTETLSSVQVSTNNGASWNTATGTTSWSYSWTLPSEDYVAHTILAKADQGQCAGWRPLDFSGR